jgi:HK97 family phage portal protein
MEGVGPKQIGKTPVPPTELYILRPDRMTIIPGNMGIVGAYRYKLGDYEKTWQVEQLTGRSPILHWKTFNPLDDWYGLSPLSAGAMATDQHNGAGAWNKALLDNSGAPSGIFTYSPEGRAGDTMPITSRRQLEQDIEDRATGVATAGRPWIVDGGISWQQLGISPREAEWLAGKKVSAQEICAVYGCATQLLGLEGSQTFANYAEARMSLYEDVVMPLLDCIADMLNVWLMPLYGDGAILVPNTENLPALQPKREKQWAAITGATWLTPNEKREAVGEEPYTGKNDDGSEITNPADLLYQPAGQSVLGTPPPAPVLPGDPAAMDKPATPDALAKELERAGVRKSKIKEMVALAYGEEKPINGRHLGVVK